MKPTKPTRRDFIGATIALPILSAATAAGAPGAEALPPPADAAGPPTILIRPRPIRTRVIHYQDEAGIKTVIHRDWKPGDSGPGGRCTLCAHCNAYGDGCTMIVGHFVTRESAPTFAPRGLPDRTLWVEPHPGLIRANGLEIKAQPGRRRLGVVVSRANDTRPDREDAPR